MTRASSLKKRLVSVKTLALVAHIVVRGNGREKGEVTGAKEEEEEATESAVRSTGAARGGHLAKRRRAGSRHELTRADIVTGTRREVRGVEGKRRRTLRLSLRLLRMGWRRSSELFVAMYDQTIK